MIKKIIKKTDKGKQTKNTKQNKKKIKKNQEDKKYKFWICLYLSIYRWIIR